jgi:hypothetical protein
MSTLFGLSMLIASPPWLLMIFFPRATLTRRLAGSSAWALAVAALYALLLLALLPKVVPVLVAPDPAGVAEVLGAAPGATLAWLHFVAFDLLVGRQVYLDSLQRGLAGWRTAPCLVLVLFFGPLGYLGYAVLRARVARAGLLEHAP